MDPHAQAIERVSEAILETPGDTAPELRRAISSYASGDGGDPPAELRPYVDKVARHAYKVVDGDIERLREAGYSEDAIFELTLAAALGAARVRLEAGLAALER
jgi:alkylhydroperoxidase family enzyme